MPKFPLFFYEIIAWHGDVSGVLIHPWFRSDDLTCFQGVHSLIKLLLVTLNTYLVILVDNILLRLPFYFEIIDFHCNFSCTSTCSGTFTFLKKVWALVPLFSQENQCYSLYFLFKKIKKKQWIETFYIWKCNH